MFFEYNGKTYCVKFKREGTTTFATLFIVDEKDGLIPANVSGVAVLYYKDKFQKSKGRKVALSDVLYQLSTPDPDGIFPNGLSKEDKAAIWQEYFKRFNK